MKSTLLGNSFVAEVYSDENAASGGDDDGGVTNSTSVVLIDTATDEDVNINEVKRWGSRHPLRHFYLVLVGCLLALRTSEGHGFLYHGSFRSVPLLLIYYVWRS